MVYPNITKIDDETHQVPFDMFHDVITSHYIDSVPLIKAINLTYDMHKLHI